MSLTQMNGSYDGPINFDNYPFELSDFQKWSIDSWENNKNVTITAHTGSGKTLPAEYAIEHTVKRNLGKVIYTCPIKSLSNDKYNSLKFKFPEIFDIFNVSTQNLDLVVVGSSINQFFMGTIGVAIDP